MKPVCDIVVLTWNQKEIIKSFVESFLENTTVSCRLIIISNACHDGTPEYLKFLQDTPLCRFKIMLNKDNRGFVGGMNQGLEISDAPYVCLANNDLLFTKGWLEEIVSIFESNKKIGLLNPNSNNLGLCPSEREGIGLLAQELKAKKHGYFIEMPFCIGFCMFIRRELIREIGGLSKEFYPIFFEDTDYSMKALKAGFLIGTAAGSYVWHKEHASFKQMGKKRKEIFIKSRETFIKKWGKILRIARIEDTYQELYDNLNNGIDLARQGNFVTFYIKNTNICRETIFKEKNSYEHSGVQFKRFGSYIGLVWGILLKKKKFDLIICKNNFLYSIFKMFGQRVSMSSSDDLISGIKNTS